jgi:hypothetical protein
MLSISRSLRPDQKEHFMKPARLAAIPVLFGLLLLVSETAQAGLITFDFADPGADTPTSAFTLCDSSGEDRCGTTMTFSKSALDVTASAIGPSGNARHVIQDLSPDRGGLGVVNSFGPGVHGGNDNVSSGDILVLTFASAISLSTVRFFDDHEPLPHSFHPSATFLFWVDEELAASYSLAGLMGPKGLEVDFGGLTGTSYYFKHAGQGERNDFYISSVTVNQEEAPEPGTLLLLGAGLLGLAARSRRRS